MEKECRQCKLTKSIDDFYTAKSSYCKVCDKARAKERYRNLSEHKKAVIKDKVKKQRIQQRIVIEKVRGENMPTRSIQNWNIANLRQLYTNGQLDFHPSYQRNSGVWTLRRQKKLIDTFLSGWMDTGKIYLRKVVKHNKIVYEVLDGKQRLTTAFAFMDGKLTIAYNGNKAATYNDLSLLDQDMFDSFELHVIVFQNMTNTEAEEMFVRLQQGVATNSQEVRNATDTFVKHKVRELAQHPFFVESVGFNNTRLGHHMVAAQMLRIALNNGVATRIGSGALNEMYETYTDASPSVEAAILKSVRVLNFLEDVFDDDTHNPDLNKSISITLFMLIWDVIDRVHLEGTEAYFKHVFDVFMDTFKQSVAERHVNHSELARFDHYQSSNSDSTMALEERVKIMRAYMAEYFEGI